MGEKTSLTLKIIVASLFTMLVVTFLFTDTFSLGESDSGASEDAPADALVGTAEGHNGPLTVAVTMDGDTITDVTVTEHAETEGLADPAIEEVPAAIVGSNSTEVDTVSGATVTSNAIMSAVEDVVYDGGATGGDSEASGDAVVETVEGHNGPLTVEVTMDGDTITDVTVTEHSETEGVADPALEEVPATIVESNSTDVDTVSGATVTSNAIIEAVNAVLNGSNDEAASEPVEYTDGTYEGTADGHNDSLSVEVTVENGEISDIVITDHAETEGIADPAFEEVPAAIMESNSTDVDTVSGATVTSNAIMSAVENALEDAQ